jgi:hypothetical protein
LFHAAESKTVKSFACEKISRNAGASGHRPANPTADISKDAGTIPPSPCGEGRDEGGLENHFTNGNSAIFAGLSPVAVRMAKFSHQI